MPILQDLSSIRAEVCDRANVRQLALQAGFREVRGRPNPKLLHCVHGADRNASAHVYPERVKCFACGRSWSAIDLVMLAQGCGYVDALKLLASETGVSWPDQSPADRKRLRQASERAPNLAEQIADWCSGSAILAERRKRQLVEAMCWAWAQGAESIGDRLSELLERIPPWALTPESADPQLIANAYCLSLAAKPEATVWVRELGRENREEAEFITYAIVDLLVRSAAEQEAAS